MAERDLAGKAGQQRASLWRESFVADHRNASIVARERNGAARAFGWRQKAVSRSLN